MAKTYKVDTGAGVVERKTDREYNFVVVAKGEHPDNIRHYHANEIKRVQDNLKYTEGQLAGTEKRYDYTDEQLTAHINADKVWLDNEASTLATKLNTAEEAFNTGTFGRTSGSWRANLGNAHDEASKLAKSYRDVRIYNVAGELVWRSSNGPTAVVVDPSIPDAGDGAAEDGGKGMSVTEFVAGVNAIATDLNAAAAEPKAEETPAEAPKAKRVKKVKAVKPAPAEAKAPKAAKPKQTREELLATLARARAIRAEQLAAAKKEAK